MSADDLNWMQEYAASEVVEHAAAGALSRRELMTRLAGICGSVTLAAAFLAACDSDSTSSNPSSSSTAKPKAQATTGATAVTPATGGVSGGAVLAVAEDDPDISAENVTFPGPAGDVFGYYAEPTAPGKRAGVIVIHEIFGLSDHIRDVTRRVAKAGYLALAVDLASRAGGSDNATNIAGALTQGPVEERVADLDAGVTYLEKQPAYNGRLGVVGFCFGGGITLSFAAAQSKVLAAVPYYGPTPQPPSVMTATHAAIMAQYGETDARVNAGIPALEQALAGKTFEQHIYPGAGHAFNNDTGGAYNAAAAVEAWTRTLEWFSQHLAERGQTAAMADEFGGVIGPSWRESTAWWEPEPAAPPNAPNVVLVVLDDVGYAQLGCYGSDIATPNIDRLAAEGVRFANFHTTALCSPTRSCLLTGRNHHSNGMARVADLAVGFPGYNGRIPRQNGFLPEMLAANGYAPVAVGKWHLTPEDETHAAAPRTSWPVGRGFQRWYGFHGGETHQFVPNLFQDNHAVQPPRSPEDGYHLSEDLAERAIQYLGEIRSVEPDQPFFLYFATGACHSPHHAPPEWIDRYRGQFDGGWDAWRDATFARQQAMGLVSESTELSPRPPWVPAWDDLEPEDQKVAARFMECFAGFLSHADAQIGAVLEFIDELGERDNTLVVLVSDNGASAEGGERGSINDSRLWNGNPAGRKELRERIDELGTQTAHNNYPWGWTMAGNTPFRRWKREVHEGGIADPCIVQWPRGVAGRGEIRHQFTHAIDVLPTILDLIGITPPAELGGVDQSPIEGASFAAALQSGSAPAHRTTQYFEMLGSRGIYHDGWKAVTFKPLGPMYDDGIDPNAPFEDDVWELYHVAEDFTECHDLAAAEPEKLAAMVEIWWEEARKYQVLPLDNRPIAALLAPRKPFDARDRYVFYPGGSSIPENVTVNVRNRNHTITAAVEIPDGTRAPEGVLLAMGTLLGGWSFHLLDGRLRYVHSYLGKDRFAVTSNVVVMPGAHDLAFSFTSNGDFSGIGELLVDGTVVGQGTIPNTTPIRYSITGAGLTCGWEQGPPVGDGYAAPFRFTGTLHRVVVDVSGVGHRDPEAEFESIMAEQ